MRVAVIAGIALLAGCASNSGVRPIGQDTFMVSRQAATGFSGSGTLKAEAFKEASDYCTKFGKQMQVVNTQEAQPPYILGNFPKAEVQFMCLSSSDSEFKRPKLLPTARVLEVKQGGEITPATSDSYSKLKKLKELLDSGVITQDEFTSEKKKVLASEGAL